MNTSINETLSRTVLTGTTTLLVTLAHQLPRRRRDSRLRLRLNVGIIVGTYSSIFVATPILLWLNDKYVASQKKQPTGRNARRSRESDTDLEV